MRRVKSLMSKSEKNVFIYWLVFSSFSLPSQILNIKFDWCITYYLLHNERKNMLSPALCDGKKAGVEQLCRRG